jgi:hypothetical protein
MQPGAVFDHLVVAAATLEQGETYLEQRLGVRPQRGGKHLAMGTHNSLLKLGAQRFLEVIAIDPEASAPPHPRWFGLDTTVLQSALCARPRLVHWVARTADIDAARRALPIDPGAVHELTRGAFAWRITVPADGSLPAGGVLPTLIQWADTRHPADTMPEVGVRLVALAGAHPQPGVIRSSLATLALAETIKITYAAQPRLAAMLQTPRGPITL